MSFPFFWESAMRVAIAGATGYTGLELLRILSAHPHISLSALTSESYAGQNFSQVYPGYLKHDFPRLEPLVPEKIAAQADIVFTALPHKEAMRVVPALLRHGSRVIDLSADFRFKSQATYERWYQEHSAPTLLARAVYGLPELYRAGIKKAKLVANPGCYPTSIILPLVPLLRRNMLTLSSIIADSKSGVSGAGRSAKTASLFCEVSETFKAYGVFEHRHQPEIEEQLSAVSGSAVKIAFSPHLVPMSRGMLSTVYARLKTRVSAAEIQELLENTYKKEPFVRILPAGALPHTAGVRGTNYCDIGFRLQDRQLVLICCIDNLVKGASGQAVQNMNIMLGLPETTALEMAPLYP
jgi:N-acetyl-gamma-glutamyl-phosphate reductase